MVPGHTMLSSTNDSDFHQDQPDCPSDDLSHDEPDPISYHI